MSVPSERLDPNDLLRDGAFDPAALLLLWIGRKLVLPLLLLGLSVAVLVTRDVGGLGDEIQRSIDNLDSPAQLLAALASPFSLIIVALVLRIGVELMALALTYPLTRWNRASDYPRAGALGRHVRLWTDRVHQAGSFRSLRWTWAVRQAAADRLGPVGRVLEALSPVLSWAAALLGVALVAAIAATT